MDYDDDLEEDIKQEEEEEEDEGNNKYIIPSTKTIRHYKKMKTANLSSFPALISIKENTKTTQSGELEEKKDTDKKLWIPDDDAQNCYNCGSKFFSLFNRKHHCRVCGNIFCKSCLETFYEITIYNEKQELKVCAYCLEKKRELNKILKNNLVEYMNDSGNKKFKTKTWDYCVNKKKNVKKTEKFCGFNKPESKLLEQFHKNLDENYQTLLKKMINQILNEKSDKVKYPNLLEDWGKTIYDLTSRVISNLSPTFQNLNDSININDYIKVKAIEYRDQSLCEVIDGYAMRKNVLAKSMQTQIKNPKILLLRGPLEGLRTNRGNMTANKNIVIKSTAIEAYMDIIKRKIQELSPQIILVEGNVLQKFQTMGITIVNKVNIKKLNRIARCVNSFVVPSPDLLGKNIVLGSCAKFDIQIIKSNMSIENRNNILHMKQDEYNLMRFEGCGQILFNTILLSGPHLDELKEIKRLMKVITKTARYLYCQKYLLKYFNMLYEPSVFNKLEGHNEKIKKKNIRRKSSIFREDNYLMGFDTEIINEKSNEFECIYMNLQNKKADNVNNTSLKNSINAQSELDKNKNLNNNNTINITSLKESQILKSTPNQCLACSYTMNAYSVAVDEEKTLGQNIFSFLEEGKERCEKCGDIKLSHTSFIYKNNGRIRISTYNLNEQINSIETISNYLGFNENLANNNQKKEIEEDDIYSYGYCEKCNQIVTPLVKLPEEILNFSATKFYQNILYNKNLINFADENVDIININSEKELFDLDRIENPAYVCKKLNHVHYRDISRIFMTKNGVVKFRYEEIIKYKLLGSQLNTNVRHNKEQHKANKKKEMEDDKKLTMDTLDLLKNKLQVHKNIIDNLKSANYSEIINKAKTIVDGAIEKVEELKKYNELIFKDEKEYENIFVYNNHLRKYLLRIMNMKIISNKLLRGIKRVVKLNFCEEVEEIIKKEQEEKKTFELSPKISQEEINNNSVNIINNYVNKSSNESNKIKGQNKEENKNDLNLKPGISSSSVTNNDKLNMSNSSSMSEEEENEDGNNENLTKKDSLKLEFMKSIESQEFHFKVEEQPEKAKEEIPSNKPVDTNLKKSIFSLNILNTNPELKEKINSIHGSYLNEMEKYTNNILELEKNELITKIISKLNLYDKNHSTYSVEVNDDDICSLISYALTSDNYLDAVKINNKNGLNEAKSEFTNNDISDDADNDLFCATSILYDKEKVKFSLGTLNNEQITQILQNELINNENKKSVYEYKYKPYELFNEVFEKKSKKTNKSNTTSKINYAEFNQKLHSINHELKNIKNDIRKIMNQNYDEINKRFDFPENDFFEESKLPTTEIKITTYYTKHFESFRILYGASYFDFLHSIMRSKEWSSVSGGKSKAHFFRSCDEKFVVKCLEENEFNMFIDSCFHYFVHNNKYFFFKMPSSLAKVVGAYKIKINSTKKSVIYCVIMENLFYGLKTKNAKIVTYDLKGSEINRYIKNKEDGGVLMDTNFVEDFGGEPLALDQKIYTLFLCSIINDTKICRNMDVMDYSLLCIIIDYKDDEAKEENDNKELIYREDKVKYIRLGVIDYFRKYTSDKQIETFVKTIINKFNKPTVINPKKYDERFFKKLSSYFIGS